MYIFNKFIVSSMNIPFIEKVSSCLSSRITPSLLLLGLLFSSCTYRFYPAECERPIPGNLIKQTSLDSEVAEPSGLLYMDGNIWTFNDSGGEPVLYCIDPRNGSVIRKTLISNAMNVDWEDIAMDEHYIYVADVGNNFGGRDTVVIFRIDSGELLSGAELLTKDLLPVRVKSSKTVMPIRCKMDRFIFFLFNYLK